MYEIQRSTKKFDTDVPEELAEYDAILNNTLCSIIKEHKEKLREEFYDEDTGRLVRSNERIILVVTWEEKKLAS